MPKTNSESEIEAAAGITFADKKLLHQALVHRSYLNETSEKESNERLEFLGDAILEFVVSEHLFQEFPSQPEGNLTAIRAKLVNAAALAKVAQEINLGATLYLSRGEEQSGGRANPGILADGVEALIGAIFLDGGINPSREFIERFVLKNVPAVVKASLKDPKSLLQEFVQAQGLPTPVYKVLKEEGPDHAKTFTVEVLIDKKAYAEGAGPSIAVATQDAAAKALSSWTKGKE